MTRFPFASIGKMALAALIQVLAHLDAVLQIVLPHGRATTLWLPEA